MLLCASVSKYQFTARIETGVWCESSNRRSNKRDSAGHPWVRSTDGVFFTLVR